MGFLSSFLVSPAGAILTSALVALATWTYHKVRGDQAASLEDTVRGIGKQVVDALVKSGDFTADKLTARATALFDAGLTRLGIDPENALVKAIVTTTVQHAVGDALAEIRERTNAEVPRLTMAEAIEQLTKAATGAQSWPADWAAAEARGRELVKDMSSMIEVVQANIPPTSPAPDPAPSAPLTPAPDPAQASPTTKAIQP